MSSISAKRFEYELPSDYELTVNDPIFRGVPEARRRMAVDAFNDLKSTIALDRIDRVAERWSISFFIKYDSEKGWSFGFGIGIEF